MQRLFSHSPIAKAGLPWFTACLSTTSRYHASAIGSVSGDQSIYAPYLSSKLEDRFCLLRLLPSHKVISFFWTWRVTHDSMLGAHSIQFKRVLRQFFQISSVQKILPTLLILTVPSCGLATGEIFSKTDMMGTSLTLVNVPWIRQSNLWSLPNFSSYGRIVEARCNQYRCLPMKAYKPSL